MEDGLTSRGDRNQLSPGHCLAALKGHGSVSHSEGDVITPGAHKISKGCLTPSSLSLSHPTPKYKQAPNPPHQAWKPGSQHAGEKRGVAGPLEVRPSSIAPNPDESREAPPNSTVSLNSQRHKPTFSLSSFTFIKRLFSSSSLSAIRVVSRGERSPWLPLKTRPDSPGESRMQP